MATSPFVNKLQKWASESGPGFAGRSSRLINGEQRGAPAVAKQAERVTQDAANAKPLYRVGQTVTGKSDAFLMKGKRGVVKKVEKASGGYFRYTIELADKSTATAIESELKGS